MRLLGLQNRIKQALYRPGKSGAMSAFTMDALAKLGRELRDGAVKAIAEAAKDKDEG